MWSMSGRPCNPGSDLRQLWQTLLRGTPFPQCGEPEPQDTPQPSSDDAPEGEPPSKREHAASVQRNR
jgi:hypothetical protein